MHDDRRSAGDCPQDSTTLRKPSELDQKQALMEQLGLQHQCKRMKNQAGVRYTKFYNERDNLAAPDPAALWASIEAHGPGHGPQPDREARRHRGQALPDHRGTDPGSRKLESESGRSRIGQRTVILTIHAVK